MVMCSERSDSSIPTSAKSLSIDNTFKIGKKATVRHNDKTYTRVLKGRVASFLNEKSETVAWVRVRSILVG